ncbi:hypothetical protein BDV06DRAFT_201416 [Aspergillus oleicola]
MTDSCFICQPLDSDLVSSISDLLNEAHIPNLLWGNYLLSTYGVPTIGISFVVPDEKIDESDFILTEAGFLPCSQPSECWHAKARYSPRPSHIDTSTMSLRYHYIASPTS